MVPLEELQRTLSKFFLDNIELNAGEASKKYFHADKNYTEYNSSSRYMQHVVRSTMGCLKFKDVYVLVKV